MPINIDTSRYQNWSKAALVREVKTLGYSCASLLAAPQSNPKLAKNMKVAGVMSFPMHLAPASLSGFNVCAKATKGCIDACLHTAGNPAYFEQKNTSRIARTQLFYRHRALFFSLLIKEIEAAKRKADKAGMLCGVRLNATSDIMWEKFRVDGVSIFDRFPDVQFYDYTKHPNRKVSDIDNYHLTFSLAENNNSDAFIALRNGINVAVVFKDKLPSKFSVMYGDTKKGIIRPVIDGDEHDFRPLDEEHELNTNCNGIFVGLLAKGKAKQDTSGFVRRAA